MRPLWLLLLLATVLSLGANSSQQKSQSAIRTSTVYYRDAGDKDWLLFGYYANEDEARAVFEHLDQAGFETELRITNVAIPTTQQAESVARGSKLLPIEQTVPLKRAQELFREMARQTDLAFRYPTDGCYARAELMVERLSQLGAKPRKIWAVANGEALHAKTKNHPRGYVTWAYHVAPALRVRDTDDSQRWYVIDPSLFTELATVTDWMKAQMKRDTGRRPYLTVTRPGRAPTWIDKKQRGESGYWPGRDPKEGPHAHAVATMKKYKPWEGKLPPKHFGQLHLDK